MCELVLLEGSSMIVRLGAAVDGADVRTNVGVGLGVGRQRVWSRKFLVAA
jgi:hypothetical protein